MRNQEQINLLQEVINNKHEALNTEKHILIISPNGSVKFDQALIALPILRAQIEQKEEKMKKLLEV